MPVIFRHHIITLLFIASTQMQFAETITINMTSSFCGEKFVGTGDGGTFIVYYGDDALNQTNCNMTFVKQDDPRDEMLCLYVFNFENVYAMEVYAHFEHDGNFQINEYMTILNITDTFAEYRTEPILAFCNDSSTKLLLSFEENVQDMKQTELAEKYAMRDVKMVMLVLETSSDFDYATPVESDIDRNTTTKDDNEGNNVRMSRAMILVLGAVVQYKHVLTNDSVYSGFVHQTIVKGIMDTVMKMKQRSFRLKTQTSEKKYMALYQQINTVVKMSTVIVIIINNVNYITNMTNKLTHFD